MNSTDIDAAWIVRCAAFAGVLVVLSIPGFAAGMGVGVGEITDVSGPGGDSVKVHHAGGATDQARPYQLIFNGDTIDVSAGAATIEFDKNDGGIIQVTPANSPFHVNSKNANDADASAFRTILRNFSYVFSPPHDMTADMTTPRSIKSTGPLAASYYLPAVVQNVRANFDQTLVVAWNGETARVSLQDSKGAELAVTEPPNADAGPGFAYVQCKPLEKGQYTLTIKDTTAQLTIPVSAVDTIPPPHGSYTEQAADASHRWGGPPGGQLQALADLQSISENDFGALYIIRSVRQGRTP